MLSTCAHTLLAVVRSLQSCQLALWIYSAEENALVLVHASICKQQCWVVVRDRRRRAHKCMRLLREKVKVCLAHARGGPRAGVRRRSGGGHGCAREGEDARWRGDALSACKRIRDKAVVVVQRREAGEKSEQLVESGERDSMATIEARLERK